MLVFVMKVGQVHCASTTLVQLWAKLVLVTEHVLLQVIRTPSVYVKMAFLVITVIKVVMVFVLESSPTVVPEILLVLSTMAVTKMEDAIISARARIIHLMVSALTSRYKSKIARAGMIMTVR